MSNINETMGTAMEKIKEMVDVNTVVGDPITTPDGTTLIPVSKVSFGFASGGTDGTNVRFGAGAGAGVTITPLAFMVVRESSVRLIYIEPSSNSTVDKLIDMIPEAADKISKLMKKDKKEKPAEELY